VHSDDELFDSDNDAQQQNDDNDDVYNAATLAVGSPEMLI
jgi:hypothetical protein